VTRVPKAEFVDPDDLPPEEWKIKPDVLAALQRIDPDQAFFFYPVPCTADALTEENKKDGLTEAQLPYAELLRKGSQTWTHPQYRTRTWGEFLRGRKEKVLESTATRTEAQKNHLKDAVKLLHDNGITHGDVHATNVVLADDGLPRVVDFDTAKVWSSRDEAFERAVKDDLRTLNDVLEGNRILTSLPNGGKRKTLRRKKQWRKRSMRSGASNRRRLGTNGSLKK
jgi:predicted Ser/Thr protein kinase